MKEGAPLRNSASSEELFENGYGDYVRIKRGVPLAPEKSRAWRIAAAWFYGKSGEVEFRLRFATGSPPYANLDAIWGDSISRPNARWLTAAAASACRNKRKREGARSSNVHADPVIDRNQLIN